MFSWICPRCGRDNPPSATNCLSCGARFDEAPEAVPASGKTSGSARASESADTREEMAQNVARMAAGAPRSNPQRFGTPIARPGNSGLPTWLMTILFFFAIIGVGAGIYYGIQYFRNRKQATSTGLDPAANLARTKLSNPLQKTIEVVGIRLVQDARKKPQARFVVVNHSSNELDDISATVTLWASTSRSEEDSVGTFTFKVSSLGAFKAQELSAPLNTKLKFYELPDWQNATPDVQITSP